MTTPDQEYDPILDAMEGRIEDIYKDRSDWDMSLMWWYRRVAKYYLQQGIPEDNVLAIMKEHRSIICPVWVKRYQNTHSPEGIAENILKFRHNPKKCFDPLAKPRVRVTAKQIAVFRQELEDEIRKLWAAERCSGVEEYVKEWCIDETDEEIGGMVRRGVNPKCFARTIFDWG